MVDNDDEAVFITRFETGATGQFKVSRVAGEHRTHICGSEGGLIRDMEKDRLM